MPGPGVLPQNFVFRLAATGHATTKLPLAAFQGKITHAAHVVAKAGKTHLEISEIVIPTWTSNAVGQGEWTRGPIVPDSHGMA